MPATDHHIWPIGSLLLYKATFEHIVILFMIVGHDRNSGLYKAYVLHQQFPADYSQCKSYIFLDGSHLFMREAEHLA